MLRFITRSLLVGSLASLANIGATGLHLFGNEPSVNESGDAWNQFLGKNRNGISTETKIVDSLDQAKELWRVPVEGGLSGIAIDQGVLYTLAQSNQKQWLVALDAATGKEKFKTAIADAYENSMGNGPRATPSVVGNVAYAYTGEGILVAVDTKTGAIKWEKNLPQEHNVKPSDYGMSCSPLVHDSLVIVHVGGDSGAVVALKCEDGSVAWKGGAGAAGYSSPVLLKLHGREQVVSLLGSEIVSLDPKTGTKLWRYSFSTEYFCNTACPVAIGNDVLISAGENHGSVLLKLEAGPQTWKVQERWKSLGSDSSMRSEWQTPILIEGALYGFDNVGSAGPVTHLTCVDAATGKSLWKQARFGKGNLIAADGKLIITTTDGEVVLVKASKEGYEELGRKAMVGFTRQAPVLVDHRLYLRDEAELVCIDFAE